MNVAFLSSRCQPLATSSRHAVLLVSLLGLVPAAFGQSGYGSPTVYASGGSSPIGIAVGDVNGDGRPDLVCANQDTDNVSVLLAQATPLGTYAAATQYAIPAGSPGAVASPTGLVLADVNGDNRLDILCADQGLGALSVLLGSATTPGTFAAPVNYASGGTTPNLLAVADVNGDGRPDVAITNTDSNTVGVLLGSATALGTFAAPVVYAVAAAPVGVALADVNGDGRPDLITSSNGNSAPAITVKLNVATAPGTFAAAVSYASGGGAAVGVAVGDLNGDSRPDLVVANNTGNTVGVLLGSATALGTFGSVVTYACARPNLVVLADLNGDGRLDVVTGNENGNTVSVLTGLATAPGTLAPAVAYPSGGTGPVGVALADLNGDNRRDIVVTNSGSNTVGVLLNTHIPLASTTAQALAATSLYPNPAHEAFLVQLPATAGFGAVQAELLNALGQVVRRQQATLAASSLTLAIDAAGLPVGRYLVRLQAGGTTLTKSILLY